MAKHLKQIEIASQYEFTPLQTLCPKCAGPFGSPTTQADGS